MAPPEPGPDKQRDWAALVGQLEAQFTSEAAMLEALGELESGENAFPEDMLARGRQIFATVCAATADRICTDTTITALLESNSARTSEVFTIIPLLLNLLPEDALKESSVALVALLIVRMGIGLFCQRYHHPPPPSGS